MSICDVERLVPEAFHPVDVEDPGPKVRGQVGRWSRRSGPGTPVR